MNNQNKTPFFDALIEYIKTDVTPFDVPGHHMGNIQNEFSKAVGNKLMRMDVNAPRGLDNLSHPTGVIKEAEKLFAEAFGADQSFFLVNGTTSGIMAMIMASVNEREKIILPRNVHKSAINGLIISGAIPVFVEPQIDSRLGIANSVTYEAYEKVILDNPDCFAILIINPTYFGATTEITKIVKLAHEHDMTVIVDEAHGSHFIFSPKLPLAAMESGADASSVSMHKTGGSLTQSSALLLKNNKKVDHFKVLKTINLLQSTSPSSLFIASLDTARKTIYFEGKEKLEKIIDLSNYARKEINAIKGLFSPDKEYFLKTNFDYDETKLIIQVNDLGFSGFEIYKMLKDEYNIQMELAETNVVLAILALGTTKEHIDNLISALKDISNKYYEDSEKLETAKFDFNFPQRVFRPREAYMAPKKRVGMNDSIGKISAESIMIYPPGIPLVIPGEKISKTIIDRIRFYESKGSTILSDYDDDTVSVVDEEKWNGWNVMYDEI